MLATELIIAKVQDHDMKAVKTNVPVQNVYEVTAYKQLPAIIDDATSAILW